VAEVLVLTRRDGTTEVAHIGSPYLAVLFEDAHARLPEGAADSGWMAFADILGHPPADRAELMDWLKQFVATDLAEYEPSDPTTATGNGTSPDNSSQN
jgi:hypothetical protein